MNHLLPLITALGLAASAQAATVLTETFTYDNGSLVGASGSPWATTSGTVGQVNVSANLVNLTGAESEDVNTSLTGGPFTVGTLTATFEVNFSVLPTGTTYFAHFLNSGTVFRSKLFSTTTGAAAGTYRLGVTNNANSGNVNVATDLALNATHTVTLTFDLDALTTSLSINGGTPVTASDTITAVSIGGIGFRQSTGIGTMTVDNLSVTHVPEPASALLGALGFLAILRRRR